MVNKTIWWNKIFKPSVEENIEAVWRAVGLLL